MKRFLVVFAFFINTIHPVFAEDRWPWESISENFAYRCVIGATTYISPASKWVSSRLSIPGSAQSLSLTIREGTSTISYATTAISGTIQDVTFDIGIFDQRSGMAPLYQNNMNTIGVPPPYMIPIGDSSITYQQVNGISNFTSYGNRFIPLSNYGASKDLILYASMSRINDATKVNNQGITFEVLFNKR